jgi:hypothetical protein
MKFAPTLLKMDPSSSIALEIPAVAARPAAQEQSLIALCRSPEFSLEKLRATVANERF